MLKNGAYAAGICIRRSICELSSLVTDYIPGRSVWSTRISSPRAHRARRVTWPVLYYGGSITMVVFPLRDRRQRWPKGLPWSNQGERGGSTIYYIQQLLFLWNWSSDGWPICWCRWVVNSCSSYYYSCRKEQLGRSRKEDEQSWMDRKVYFGGP